MDDRLAAARFDPAAFDTARGWIRDGRAAVPLPGAGETWKRWSRLLELGRADLPAARIVEAHVDAVAILAELEGPEQVLVGPDDLWAVWAAEPPKPRVSATRSARSWTLDGTKAWCSAASFATHALLTAEADPERVPRLFRVDLRDPGVTPQPRRWASAGMASTDTGAVSFDGVRAHAVGTPTGYLERAGFWHGGIGVACCWWGGAQGLIDLMHVRLRARSSELAEAHLGACVAWDTAITGALRAAASDVDAAPDDLPGARRRALALRSLIDRACTDVITRFGRALGAGPYATDPVATQRIADLQVYVRQSHAETDEAELARLTLAECSRWIVEEPR